MNSHRVPRVKTKILRCFFNFVFGSVVFIDETSLFIPLFSFLVLSKRLFVVFSRFFVVKTPNFHEIRELHIRELRIQTRELYDFHCMFRTLVIWSVFISWKAEVAVILPTFDIFTVLIFLNSPKSIIALFFMLAKFLCWHFISFSPLLNSSVASYAS